ncbi:putative taste receptor type 2 member 33 [Xenopus laevis]|uniref:Taste receptor type 2 n=2 Tax=Xenopus laevis TaxID=8355 RepID=A0A1L8EZ34_XENLA|nr:putative taste receptor type 2 member 33 [Xenopus laevis]OCT64601.1 hypothetical protein XELAEV_18045700mg [Xenopus laevis]
MLSKFHQILAFALFITWTCGTVLNSSIVAVYVSDWKKGLKLGACDQIILTMGCNNLLMQSFLTFELMVLTYQLYGLFTKDILLSSFFFGFNMALSLSLWLTAWLSSYYYLRLVNFSNRFFIRLKRGISTVVVYCLLGTVVGLFLVHMPVIWTMHIIRDQNITKINSIFNDKIPFLFNFTFSCYLPTSMTSFCIVLTLMSLLKHIHKMKQNTSEFWNPQLKNHVKACRTMLLLFAANLILFLAIFVSSLQYNTGTIGNYVIWFIMISNPSSQAIILLFGNSRLATAWSKFLSFQ